MKRFHFVINIIIQLFVCKTPTIDADVDLHFIAFVQKDGELFELDGAKEAPISHGHCEEGELLEVSI